MKLFKFTPWVFVSALVAASAVFAKCKGTVRATTDTGRATVTVSPDSPITNDKQHIFFAPRGQSLY